MILSRSIPQAAAVCLPSTFIAVMHPSSTSQWRYVLLRIRIGWDTLGYQARAGDITLQSPFIVSTISAVSSLEDSIVLPKGVLVRVSCGPMFDHGGLLGVACYRFGF
ncbi:hypothetical protein GYMLUDRAFT_68160 [Collybiopsis luxurians FD-317 M1]|nr:hypothetical protein GYMLUDRAFT_68160 [Collybiopsis luxurians FD-317 M1]